MAESTVKYGLAPKKQNLPQAIKTNLSVQLYELGSASHDESEKILMILVKVMIMKIPPQMMRKRSKQLWIGLRAISSISFTAFHTPSKIDQQYKSHLGNCDDEQGRKAHRCDSYL